MILLCAGLQLGNGDFGQSENGNQPNRRTPQQHGERFTIIQYEYIIIKRLEFKNIFIVRSKKKKKLRVFSCQYNIYYNNIIIL